MRFALLLVVVGGLGYAASAADRSSSGVAPEGGQQPAMDCRLYTKPYEVNEHGAIALPTEVKWRVLPQYRGRGAGGEPIVDNRLTLVLEDGGNHFWPVIAKMSVEDAQTLRDELTQVLDAKLAANDAKRAAGESP